MTQEVRKLYRSREDRMVAGVAAGLGKFLDIDPTVIRLIFAFSVFLGGTGVLVYLVMLLVVPEEPLADSKPAPRKTAAKKTSAKKSSAKKSS